MKRSVMFAITLSLAVLLTAVVPAAAQHNHPFRGTWIATDGDGSNLTLQFLLQSHSDGKVFDARGSDDSAFCSLGPCQAAQMTAVGALEGTDSVHISAIWWAKDTVDPLFYFVDETYNYDAESNTLVQQSDGIVFHRAP